MQELFHSRPLTIADGTLIVAIGLSLFAMLEAEKALMRRTGWFDELRA
jgi:hypothetical protein